MYPLLCVNKVMLFCMYSSAWGWAIKRKDNYDKKLFFSENLRYSKYHLFVFFNT